MFLDFSDRIFAYISRHDPGENAAQVYGENVCRQLLVNIQRSHRLMRCAEGPLKIVINCQTPVKIEGIAMCAAKLPNRRQDQREFLARHAPDHL